MNVNLFPVQVQFPGFIRTFNPHIFVKLVAQIKVKVKAKV
jgi:hypothetical protein